MWGWWRNGRVDILNKVVMEYVLIRWYLSKVEGDEVGIYVDIWRNGILGRDIVGLKFLK